MQNAISQFDKKWQSHLEDLKTLIRIPSVSFDGFDPIQVRKSAQAVSELLKKTGLEQVEVLELEGAHPYVYGEKIIDPARPTLLLYAHHDVQPIGREKVWQTSPFEPVEKEGPGGMRLYARGAADDKAGVIVHTAAISSYLSSSDSLPVNVKVLIEGEEEIGSPHLREFLEKYREKLSADVMVLTDTLNFDVGMPALTVALRGMVGMEIEVRSLSKTIHSGMWGGPVPDPAMGLNKILASLVDENGRIAVPKIQEMIPALSSKEEKEFSLLPFDEARFREQSGLREGVQILRQGPHPGAQIWAFPSLTVNAQEASSRKQAGNIINDSAWAKITLRLVPGMEPSRVRDALAQHLEAQTPWGLEIQLTPEENAPAWSTEPERP